MRNALSLFRRFQLIELLDRDLGNEESRIIIYNSILMAVRIEDIKQAYEKLGVSRVQALKYHVSNIKRELVKNLSVGDEYKIVKMINTTLPKQTAISKNRIKAELQRIYDTLGIKRTAKASDLSK